MALVALCSFSLGKSDVNKILLSAISTVVLIWKLIKSRLKITGTISQKSIIGTVPNNPEPIAPKVLKLGHAIRVGNDIYRHGTTGRVDVERSFKIMSKTEEVV